MRTLLHTLIPVGVRRSLRETLNSKISRLKAPRMVLGYRDASGILRKHTRISDTVFFNHRGKIFIEDNVFIGHYSILDGTGGLEIGEGCQFAAWNGIYTHSSHIAIRLYGAHYQEVPEYEKTGFKVAPVRFGRYVFVGAGAKILPGVTVGNGALVAAGSIVTRGVGEFEIVSGNPAKIIGDTRKLDERFLEDQRLRDWYYEWQ